MTPYLLRTAGLHNTVIQRIHYGFKQWLADRQISEFYWKMSWNTKGSILCHHFPFDIYSTKHSCGLDPLTCLAFDFRAENPLRAVPITNDNVRSKAETLLEQYAKSGSLTKHNVVLALVGNDFRYINGAGTAGGDAVERSGDPSQWRQTDGQRLVSSLITENW